LAKLKTTQFHKFEKLDQHNIQGNAPVKWTFFTVSIKPSEPLSADNTKSTGYFNTENETKKTKFFYL